MSPYSPDRALLLAENRRLRAKHEHLRAELKRLHAEKERLQAENEKAKQVEQAHLDKWFSLVGISR